MKAKTLVIYYSYEGNTRFVAETIAHNTDADLLELKPRKDISSHGFMKYVWGGRQVVYQKKPELLPFEKNPNDYDLIFLGTPVWAYTFTPALRSFFAMNVLSNKKIALFCSNDGDPRKTLEKMAKQLPNNTIISQADFLSPLKYKEDTQKNVISWVKDVLSKIN